MTIESAAGVERVRIEEDSLGRETARVREGGYAIRTTRDDSGRPVVLTVEDAAGRPLRERRYAWSAAGPVTEIDPGYLLYRDSYEQWRGPWMNGQQLGQAIRNAGFRGETIHMTLCHGGTVPPGYPGGSVANHVTMTTGATTIGCVGDKMYDHATLPGVTIAGSRGRMMPFEPISSPHRNG